MNEVSSATVSIIFMKHQTQILLQLKREE